MRENYSEQIPVKRKLPVENAHFRLYALLMQHIRKGNRSTVARNN